MWQVVLSAFLVSIPVGPLGLWVMRKMLKRRSPWPLIGAGSACVLVTIFWAVAALGTLDLLNSWIPGVEHWLNGNRYIMNLFLGPFVALFGGIHFYYPSRPPKQLNEPSPLKFMGDFGIGLGFSILPGNFLFTVALYVLLGVDIQLLMTSWQVDVTQATWLAGAGAGAGAILSWLFIVGLVYLLTGKRESQMQRLVHALAGLTTVAGLVMVVYGAFGTFG
jgi:hypothetical protein